MLQTEALFTILNYDHETFVVQATSEARSAVAHIKTARGQTILTIPS